MSDLSETDRQEIAQEVISQLGGYSGRIAMIKTMHQILKIYLSQGNQENKAISRIRDDNCAKYLKIFFRGDRVSKAGGTITSKKVSLKYTDSNAFGSFYRIKHARQYNNIQ